MVEILVGIHNWSKMKSIKMGGVNLWYANMGRIRGAFNIKNMGNNMINIIGGLNL